MKSYHDFLVGMQQRFADNHSRKERFEESCGYTEINGKTGPVSPNYLPLQNKLLLRPSYQAYRNFDAHPEDHCKRRLWYENLKSNFAIGVYVHQRKNFLINLNYVWKIPRESERNQEDLIETLNGIKKIIPKYLTRAMHKEFFDWCSKFGTEPAVFREIYRFTTDDESAGSCLKEVQVDKRLINFILESNGMIYYEKYGNSLVTQKNQHLIPFGKSYRNI